MSAIAPEALIVSSGSEVVSLAVAEALHAAVIPYAVISLVPDSVLRGAPGCTALVDLSGELASWPRLRDAFLRALASNRPRGSQRLAIFPTEDGSLRLLNECRDEVLEHGEFSRARNLRLGGVDKAEVVERLEQVGLTEGIARSLVLAHPQEALHAFGVLGQDAVIKPALKPLDMDLSGLGGRGSKVITRSGANETPAQVIARLSKAWSLSERWIAQPRLSVGPGIERSVCAVRFAGQSAFCQVQEQAKFPRMGGTAYWVSMDTRDDLVPAAGKLMEALDVVGMSELSYLPDPYGSGAMIEFNPRPWLQLSLVEAAGFPIVARAVAALAGRPWVQRDHVLTAADWIQPERMALAMLAGEISPGTFLRMAGRMCRASTTLGGYGSRLPKARSRLLARSVRKAFRR